MIKAVLFDFDGTLIDTNELIFTSYNKAFNEVLNREISREEILQLFGRPLYSSLAVYGDAQDGLYEAYRKYNAENHDLLAKPFPGVYEGVHKLSEMGFRLGIVTSKRLPFVKRGLEKIINLDGMFEIIVTPDDTEKGKPDPAPILFGCEKLGILPCEAIYVGDSIFDLQAGRCAGTEICAVKYSETPHSELFEYKPEYFVDTILELADKLENI